MRMAILFSLFLALFSCTTLKRDTTISFSSDSTFNLSAYFSKSHLSPYEGFITINISRDEANEILNDLKALIDVISFNCSIANKPADLSVGKINRGYDIHIFNQSFEFIEKSDFYYQHDPTHPFALKSGELIGFVAYPLLDLEIETKKLKVLINLYNLLISEFNLTAEILHLDLFVY